VYGQGRVESLVESAMSRVQEVTGWSSALAKAKLGRRKWNVEHVVNESFGETIDEEDENNDDVKRERDRTERQELLPYRLSPGELGYRSSGVESKDEEKPAEKRDKRGETKSGTAASQKEKEKVPTLPPPPLLLCDYEWTLLTVVCLSV
jgi:hypothetical protein